MLIGVSCALGAGMLWAIAFVAPLLLPDFSPVEITAGRYLFFGLSSLMMLSLLDGRALTRMPPWLWAKALWLTLIGNVGYYACLTAAMRLSGVVLPTLIIGILPVTVALVGNVRNKEIAFKKLFPPIAIILTGLLLVHTAETRGVAVANVDFRYAVGLGLATCALVLWTWYGVANALHLKAHPELPSITWASMTGLATLPILAAAGGLVAAFGYDPRLDTTAERNVVGFLVISAIIGILSSWVATWLWNRASTELPTALAGQLIVFETIAALAYAFLLEGRVPSLGALAGSAFLIAGVLWGIRIFSRSAASLREQPAGTG